MNCSDCGKPVHAKNKRGLCRPCFARMLSRNPAARAKAAASNARFNERNPEARKLIARKAAATKKANPETMARLADNMRRNVQPKSYAPEVIARRDPIERGKKISMAKLPWCPPAYIPEYHWLCDTKLLLAAEARAIILDKIEAEKRRLAKLSPFERQDRALMRGGRIVANDAAPSLHNPADYGERKWA